MKWEKIEEDALPIRSWCEEVEAGALVQARNLAHHPALAHHVALMPADVAAQVQSPQS